MGRAAIDGRIVVQQAVVADLDSRVAALDAMVKAATKRAYVKTAMALVAEQAKGCAELVSERTAAATAPSPASRPSRLP